MMGSNDKPQNPLFYSFNLDEVVPEDHLLRHIDRFLDFSDLRQHLAAYYSPTGRPSVDPELMIRMLLIGYCLGIRSERQLCEEVKLNLAYRWFCRLSITDAVPDHSTFSKNRHGRFREAEAFRYVFEQVLKRCIEAGLVKGEGFAVDASVVKADASRQREHKDDDDWGSGPGVREYLEGLDAAGPSSQPPRRVSPTDPAARWTAAPGGPAFYAYSTNYLVDTEAGIIVDVEATPAHRSQEVESTKTMVERVKDRFGIDTKKLIGDTAYGTAEFLAWMVNEKASSRMCRCGRKRNDPTTRSRARTLASMRRATLTPARTASCSIRGGATSRRFAASRRPMVTSAIAHRYAIAAAVR